MNTLSQIEDFSFNRKVETRRLTARSTVYTNCFYNNTIISKSLFENIESDIDRLNKLKSIIDSKGGPILIEFSNTEENILNQMIRFLVVSLNELTSLRGNDIAVLTPYVETLTFLQQNLKSETNSRNYLIESVDRVQGLDVDYCFYVIPKSSSFSFNLNRFNVATSRAKKSTFILVEKDFDRFVNLPSEVGNYLSELRNEFAFAVNSISGEITKIEQNESKLKTIKEEADTNSQNNFIDDNTMEVCQANSQKRDNDISIKILGKIDVSKFERPKKEIKKNKENLYVIDTNIFVDYPEIISKIDKKYPIILSAKVIDELDNLKSKLNNKEKRNVQRALKSINGYLDTRDLRMEMSDISLLPEDFNKKSPDNQILTVALKFKSENPIILTSDNGLQVKAKGLNLTTISLQEFLNQLKRR